MGRHDGAMDDAALNRLVHAVIVDLPQPFLEWPGGWPDQIEAALIDAVLSIRAKYGQPHNGVRGAVAQYRGAQEGPLNSLQRLAGYEDAELQALLGIKQETSGRSKASAIIEAARALGAQGVEQAADLDVSKHKKAYVSVHGLGPVTWEYFTMLMGKPGVKADRWIIRWVSDAVGRSDDQLSSAETRALLVEAHEQLKVSMGDATPSLTQLDHAIWSHARRRT